MQEWRWRQRLRLRLRQRDTHHHLLGTLSVLLGTLSLLLGTVSVPVRGPGREKGRERKGEIVCEQMHAWICRFWVWMDVSISVSLTLGVLRLLRSLLWEY